MKPAGSYSGFEEPFFISLFCSPMYEVIRIFNEKRFPLTDEQFGKEHILQSCRRPGGHEI